MTVTLLGGGANAQTEPCSWDDGEVTILIASGQTGRLSLGSKGELLLNDGSCETATRDTTKTISVFGVAGNETFVVSEANGEQFSSTFDVHLGDGPNDRVVIVGDRRTTTSRLGSQRCCGTTEHMTSPA
jgi:hypothetical protein